MGGMGGMADFRQWSVNTWIIVINCAIFVLGATLLAKHVIPVLERRNVSVGVTNVEVDRF